MSEIAKVYVDELINEQRLNPYSVYMLAFLYIKAKESERNFFKKILTFNKAWCMDKRSALVMAQKKKRQWVGKRKDKT